MSWSTSLCKKSDGERERDEEEAINFSFMTNFLIKKIFKIHFLSKNVKALFFISLART